MTVNYFTYRLYFFILLYSFFIPEMCVSQTDDSLFIQISKIRINSRCTQNNDNFISFIFGYNKYLRIPVKCKAVNDAFISNNVEVIILDESYREKEMRTFWRGNRDLSGGTINESRNNKEDSKRYSDQNLKIEIKGNNRIIIKKALRYIHTTPVSSTGIGYDLEKGVYELKIKYTMENRTLLSSSVRLYVK